MRYEQKQIDKFLAEAKTSDLDILDLSKKHGIHHHTGNKWARKFLPRAVLEAVRKRARSIRAEHAAATRQANAALQAGAQPKKAVAAKATAVRKDTAHTKAKASVASAAKREGKKHSSRVSARQALATMMARMEGMVSDMHKIRAALGS